MGKNANAAQILSAIMAMEFNKSFAGKSWTERKEEELDHYKKAYEDTFYGEVSSLVRQAVEEHFKEKE